jgi:predicted nucleic acid-binding protein
MPRFSLSMRNAAGASRPIVACPLPGLLGVLAEAKVRGVIAECRPVLEDMIRDAGFWIGDDLPTRYLRNMNEIE